MSSNPAPSAPPPYAPQGGEGEPTPQYAQPPYGQQPPPQQPYQYPVQNIGYAQAQAGYGYPPGYPPQQYPQYAPAYPAQPGYAYPQAYPAQPVAQMAYGAQQPYYPPQPYQGVGVVAVNPNQVQYSTTFVRSMFAASLIGLILVAVMLGAPGWYQYSQTGGDAKVGLFSACVSYSGYSSCGSICDSSNKTGTCNKIRALRAFVILGLVILALYTILRFMLACSGNMALPSKGRRQFQLCASIGGLLAFIVSIAIAGALFKDFTDYSPSYCFFLCIINIGLTFSFVVNDFRLTRMP